MSEADREDGLAGDPPVGKDADEVLGREGLEHEDKELDGSRMPLSEGELSHSTGILGSGSTPSSMLTS